MYIMYNILMTKWQLLFQSWAWTVKAVNELSESSDEVLRLVVVSHAVKVCSVVNKLDIAKKLIDQLHTYNKVIEEHIYVDMLINEACYLLKADLAKDSIKNYYVSDLFMVMCY